MLRGFTGLPVLDEDGVELDEPLRLRNERLGVDTSGCFVQGALLRLQNLAGLLAEDLVGAGARGVHVVAQRTGGKSLCSIVDPVVVIKGFFFLHVNLYVYNYTNM